MLTEAEPANSFVLLNKLNCLLGSVGTYPGSKVTGRDAEYTPPSSAEVKGGWSYTSAFPYAFMTCTGTTLPLPSTDN